MSLTHLLMLVGLLLGVLAWMALAKGLRGHSLSELSADADVLAREEEAEDEAEPPIVPSPEKPAS